MKTLSELRISKNITRESLTYVGELDRGSLIIIRIGEGKLRHNIT